MFYVYFCAEHKRFYRKTQDDVCPKCTKKAEYVSSNKNRPSNAWHAVGLSFERKERVKVKRQDNDDQYTFDIEDEEDEEEIVDDGEIEDEDEFLLPVNFRSDMRYTKGRRSCDLKKKTLLVKSLSWTAVGNAAVRKDATKVMGCSARKAAGRGTKYKVNKFTSCEWCHMLADSLGGPTVQNNLVASSFAANTAMMVIEKLIHDIKNKYTVEVCIKAYGTVQHVADFIKYKIRCTKKVLSNKKIKTSSGEMEFLIDGTNDEFSKSDALEFKQVFKAWLLNPSISKSYC